jgi:putative transposase
MIRTKIFRARQPKSILDELNRESGKVYTEVMVEHWRVYRKKGVWMGMYTEEKYNDYLHPVTNLQAHSKDAAQLAFSKAVKTTHALRKAGFPDAKFPHKVKLWRTTVWLTSGIRVKDGIARLSRAKGLEPIQVTLPEDIKDSKFLEVRLVYNKKQSHYEWHFVIDDGIMPESKTEGAIVAVDLGEIHPAVMTDGNTALVISARELRATGQGLAKKIANLDSRLSRCKRGSRMYRKLRKAKSKSRRNADARQKDILHKVSRAIIDYAIESNAKEIVIGDIRDISDEVNLGKKSNQKISLWPHGKLTNYVKYKSAALGIAVTLENEAYTTQTCPCCGEKQKPRGRVYKCRKCGFVGHRDVVGASNILSRHLYGELARVQVRETKYRHPYFVGKRSHADTMQVACASKKPRQK